MPNYRYRCLDCRKGFEVFLTYAEYGQKTVVCPRCNSTNVQRRVERVRVARAEQNMLESFGDDANLEGLENNPQELGRMMRRMSAEAGEDMGPEFDEVIGRLEKGESPEQIEQSLPDLGGDAADMGGAGGGGFGPED